MTADGEVLGVARIPAQPFELMQALAEAGPEPEVVMESTYGWYWAADVLGEWERGFIWLTRWATTGGIAG